MTEKKPLRLQAMHMYKYTKFQGPLFQRNYIIARDRKTDLHGTSFQSLLKINCIYAHNKTYLHAKRG